MTQVINTGGGDSGAGVALVAIFLLAILVGGYFFMQNGGFSTNTTNIEAPDVNIEAPDVNPASGN